MHKSYLENKRKKLNARGEDTTKVDFDLKSVEYGLNRLRRQIEP